MRVQLRLEGVRRSAHCVEAVGGEEPADKCAYVGRISVGGGLGLYPNFEGVLGSKFKFLCVL